MMNSGIYLTTALNSEVQFLVKLEYNGTMFEETPILNSQTLCNISSNLHSSNNGILCEERIIKWQQKIENPFFERSAMPDNHPSTSAQPVQRRLFTYVNGETPSETTKLKFDTTAPADDKLVENDEELSVNVNSTWNSRVVPLIPNRRRNPVVDLPTNETRRKARRVKCLAINMYIMAYLGPLEKERELYDTNDEFVVCKICMLNGKIITFEPDVTDGKRTLQSRYGNYTASVTVDNSSCFTALHDVPEEQKTHLPVDGFGAFEMPEEGHLLMNYLVEIEKGVNFPHNDLYVEYMVEVPDGIQINGDNSKGCTHTSLTKSIDGNDVAVFSHSFPVQLTINPKAPTSNFFSPRILVKVCAEDLWGRYYVDGYGFTTLPLDPGRHKLNISCWKLVDLLNRKAALFDYFISQSADIDCLEFNGLSDVLTQSKRLSRIGLTMECSGELKLNVSCILQAQDFIPRDLFRQMTYNSAVERTGLHSNLHWKIMKVLIEFEKAKSQFMEIRDRFVPNLEINRHSSSSVH